jgi:phage shock protein E
MKPFIITLLISILGFSPVTGGNFFRNIKVAQADKLIREHEGKGDLVILDVRKPGEFAAGHIKGAINIDFWSKGFAGSASKLDKEQTYLVYCTSGVRSGGAMKEMRKLGFAKIYNMKKGLFGWRAAKLPLVTSDK